MALTQLEFSDYFAIISPLARKMVAEAKEVITREGDRWNEMTQEERDQMMDRHFIDPAIGAQYEMTNTLGDGNIDNTALDTIFPRLKLQCRQEAVHYKEGDQEVGYYLPIPLQPISRVTKRRNLIRVKDTQGCAQTAINIVVVVTTFRKWWASSSCV